MTKPEARCWTMPAEWVEAIQDVVNAAAHAGRVTVHVDLGASGRPTELLVQPPARRVRAGETRADSLTRYAQERTEDANAGGAPWVR